MSQQRESEQDRLERIRRKLAWFVVRARRVEAHSLMQDRVRVSTWASQTPAEVRTGPDGVPRIRWVLPAEEPFESLAARCRPFLLDRDAVHFLSNLGDLQSLVRSDPDLVEKARQLRADWNSRVAKGGDDAFTIAQVEADGSMPAPKGDRDLGYWWVYGDLVHGDDIREAVGSVDIDHRYRAAVRLVNNIAFQVMKMLELIREAQVRGLVELDPDASTLKVSADPNRAFPVSMVVTGPAGTPAAELAPPEFLLRMVNREGASGQGEHQASEGVVEQ